MSKNHFVSHFLPFQITTTIFIFVNFVYKMAAGGHFGCSKITFGRMSGHFRSIRNFFKKIFTKWLPSAILDVRNSLWITFLAILDQYRFFNFYYKMAASGHFGCPKITFDLISIHFTSIRCRRPFWMSGKSLSVACLAISDQYATFF